MGTEKLHLAIDMHVHVDEQVKYKLIPGILRFRNLDGVGIVTHNDLVFARKVKDFLNRNDPEKIYFAGVEIDTLDGHLIAYGINEEIQPDLSATKTIELIRQQGGISIIPHPILSHNSLGLKARFLKADAMEFYNGFAKIFLHIPNIMAEVAFKRNNFARIGGSDAHSAYAVGSCYSIIETHGKRTVDAIFEAIRHHKIKPAFNPIDQYDIRNFLNIVFTPKQGRKVIRFKKLHF